MQDQVDLVLVRIRGRRRFKGCLHRRRHRQVPRLASVSQAPHRLKRFNR